jgi:redox-sensing transcriptional repressor
MSNRQDVSRAVVERLPKYYRHLDKLLNKGKERISSSELGQIVGVSAPQLRQDLNHFGNFGQQGYGYNIKKLHQAVGRILGITDKSKMVLVGVGNLGQALVNSSEFMEAGFYLSAVFDINPRLIGFQINGFKVKDIKKLTTYLANQEIDIGIITVPEEAAQEVADKMVLGEIDGIWNFTPAELDLPDQVKVEDEHLTEGLMKLSFQIQE